MFVPYFRFAWNGTKNLVLHDGVPYLIETSPSICSANKGNFKKKFGKS